MWTGNRAEVVHDHWSGFCPRFSRGATLSGPRAFPPVPPLPRAFPSTSRPCPPLSDPLSLDAPTKVPDAAEGYTLGQRIRHSIRHKGGRLMTYQVVFVAGHAALLLARGRNVVAIWCNRENNSE